MIFKQLLSQTRRVQERPTAVALLQISSKTEDHGGKEMCKSKRYAKKLVWDGLERSFQYLAKKQKRLLHDFTCTFKVRKEPGPGLPG